MWVMAWYRTGKVASIPAIARAVGVTSTLWMAVLIILDASEMQNEWVYVIAMDI
jgi:hypothetical protein